MLSRPDGLFSLVPVTLVAVTLASPTRLEAGEARASMTVSVTVIQRCTVAKSPTKDSDGIAVTCFPKQSAERALARQPVVILCREQNRPAGCPPAEHFDGRDVKLVRFD